MRLRLFGPPQVRVHGRLLPLPLGKPLALLCYLAATAPRPASRQELCALLWDDPQPQHLRQALYTLRRVCGGELAVEGRALLRYAGQSELTGLQAVPDGVFLDGLETVSAPGFPVWLAGQRRHWASRGVSQVAGAGWPGAGLSGAGLLGSGPSSVQDFPDEWLLWAQAVWGSPDPGAISRLLFGDDSRSLEVAGRLRSEPVSATRAVGVGHTAISRTVPEAASILLHTRAARLLQQTDTDPAGVAGHYLLAQDPAQASPFLLAAARRSLAARQPEQAQRQALTALWTAPDLPARAEALFVLEQLAEQGRETAVQTQWLAELERLVFQSQSDELLYRLALLQARRRQSAGKPGQAAQAARSALEIARRLRQVAWQHEASLLLGALALGGGQLAEAASAFRPLLAAPDAGLQMRARLNLGAVYAMQGQRRLAVQHLERALTLARQQGHLTAVAAALNNLAGNYEGLARYADAARMAREAYQLATQQGDLQVRVTALLNMAEFHRAAGAYGPCWNTVQEALELLEPGTFPELQSALLARQGMLERRFGRPEVAHTLLFRALTLARQRQGARAALIAEMQLALMRLPGDQAQAELALIARQFRTHGYGLLADLTELHAVHHDPQATSGQLLAVFRQHRRHPHPHLAWLAAFQGFRAGGTQRLAVLRALNHHQFAEAPEVLALLGQPEDARALRLEQARGLPDTQRRALLRVPL